MRQPVQQLIQLYQNNLFTAAFNICQNQMDAEDAVQETFVQYYTSRKEFENEQHIRAWLLRVVINKAKNINRTFWKKNKCSLEDYMETLSFPDSQSRDLFEEVMKLPDKYRIVIHLFYYEDYLRQGNRRNPEAFRKQCKGSAFQGKSPAQGFFKGGMGK